MRCPKCHTNTPADALCCPACKRKTPKGRMLEEEPETENRSRFIEILARQKPTVNHVPVWVAWALMGLTIAVCVLGSYIRFTHFSQAEPTDQPLHQVALSLLRNKTSNQSWMTIEESMQNEVEKSRKAGRLVEAEGWEVATAEQGEYAVSYTFQEKEGRQVRALWKVNPIAETFVPQDELASAIFKP
jgi:hypothetical protein